MSHNKRRGFIGRADLFLLMLVWRGEGGVEDILGAVEKFSCVFRERSRANEFHGIYLV